MDALYRVTDIKITQIKKELYRRGWGEAMELLSIIVKQNHSGFVSWLKSGSTVELREIAEPYRTWSIYSHRLGPLPFENDVDSIDSVGLVIS